MNRHHGGCGFADRAGITAGLGATGALLLFGFGFELDSSPRRLPLLRLQAPSKDTASNKLTMIPERIDLVLLVHLITGVIKLTKFVP
jgi:hypothetical protein